MTGDEAGHHTIEHCRYDNERYSEGYERALEFYVREAAVAVDKHNGWNAQQVKQVNADRQSGHISNEDQPAVRMCFIGFVFPLEDKQKNDRCKSRRISI